MYLRLLEFLRCPSCRAELTCMALESQQAAAGGEIISGVLHCSAADHWFPIVGGIPRMLLDAIQEHWPALEKLIPQPVPVSRQPLLARLNSQQSVTYHRVTAGRPASQLASPAPNTQLARGESA